MSRKKTQVEPTEPVDHVAAPAPAEAPVAKAAPPSGSITVTYTGDPRRGGEGPEGSVFAGVPMTKGKPVVISDAAWIKKFGSRFRRNGHFRVE
jgi:hypothetical protein